MNSPRRLQLLLATVAASYFVSTAFFPGLLFLAGVNHYGVWFLDSFALLASSDAVTRGLDPYAVNPLDYFHRPHVYSPWWLHLRDLGLTRAQNLPLGFAFVGAFFFAAVVRLRPRSGGEMLWMLAFLCSSPVLLAINRANNDLVVFALLAPVVPCLLSPHRAVRIAAVPLIALAAGLKYYPAIAGVVLLAGDDPREIRRRIVAVVLLLAFVVLSVGPDFVRVAPLLPKAQGLVTFGAANIFEAVGFSAGKAKLAGLGAGALITLLSWRSTTFAGWRIDPAERGAWLSFILGAALLTGCFLTGTNFAYRWVFALWMAPLLWRLPREVAAPVALRRFARLTGWLTIMALWADPMVSSGLTLIRGRVPVATIGRWADTYFLFEQPVTWALFACLLAFLVHFVRETLPPLLRFRRDGALDQPAPVVQ